MLNLYIDKNKDPRSSAVLAIDDTSPIALGGVVLGDTINLAVHILDGTEYADEAGVGSLNVSIGQPGDTVYAYQNSFVVSASAFVGNLNLATTEAYTALSGLDYKQCYLEVEYTYAASTERHTLCQQQIYLYNTVLSGSYSTTSLPQYYSVSESDSRYVRKSEAPSSSFWILNSNYLYAAQDTWSFGLGTSTPSEKFHTTGNARIDGNVIVNGYVTGSLRGNLTGTASRATTSSYTITASNAFLASYANIATTATTADTANYAYSSSVAFYATAALSASNAYSSSYGITSSYAIRAITSSYGISASYASQSFRAITSSYVATASYALSSPTTVTASYALTSSYSLTSVVTSSTQFVSSASWASSSLSSSLAKTASYIGSGTNNYLPKWSSNTLTGTSNVYDDGTNVGIGTSVPGVKLDILSGSGIWVKPTDVAPATDYVLRIGNGNYASIESQMVQSNATYGNNFAYYSLNNNGNIAYQLGIASGSFVIAYGTGSSNKNIFASKSLYITSAGNVGIGYGSPTIPLHVVVADNDLNQVVGLYSKNSAASQYGSAILRVGRRYESTSTGSGATNLTNEYSDLEYNSHGNGPFRFGSTYCDTNLVNGWMDNGGRFGNINFVTSGSIRMTIAGGTSAGKIGINNTNPSYNLDISGSLRVANDDTSNYIGTTKPMRLFNYSGYSGGGQLWVSGDGVTDNVSLALATSFTYPNAVELAFHSASGQFQLGSINSTLAKHKTFNFYVNGSERVTISGSTLGVGVSTPTKTLDINGNARIRGGLELNINTDTLSNAYWNGTNFARRSAGFASDLYTDSSGSLHYVIAGSDLADSTINFGTTKLSVLNSGVGIGTSSPSATLHVQGNISASSITASVYGTSSWANYSKNGNSASFASSSISSSYAISASYYNQLWLVTGSTYPITSSVATTASYYNQLWLVSGSTYPITSSRAVTASYASTSSYAANAANASYATDALTAFVAASASYTTYAESALTSSYAINSRWAVDATTATTAGSSISSLTAQYATSCSYSDVSAVAITANSVAANSVNLGTDTVGNYVKNIGIDTSNLTLTGGTGEGVNVSMSLKTSLNGINEIYNSTQLMLSAGSNVRISDGLATNVVDIDTVTGIMNFNIAATAVSKSFANKYLPVKSGGVTYYLPLYN